MLAAAQVLSGCGEGCTGSRILCRLFALLSSDVRRAPTWLEAEVQRRTTMLPTVAGNMALLTHGLA